MKLKDKVAIVTGASVGIGEATADLFVQEGAKVVVNSQSKRAGKVAQRIVDNGGEALFVQGRVQVPEDAQRIIDKTVDHFGRIDILINNAGVVFPGSVDNSSIEDWDLTFAVNCRGVFLMSKFSVLQMLAQGGGVIVHNASIAGVKGLKQRATYCASKGAVVALTKAMALDYIDKNIRVNCVNPGTTMTPSLQDRINAFDDPVAAKQMFISRQPMGRLGKSHEIAAGMLYLASDDSSFVTGQVLNIDGGLSV